MRCMSKRVCSSSAWTCCLTSGHPHPPAQGDFRAKKFKISQVLPGADRVVAEVKKESKFSSATAFLRSGRARAGRQRAATARTAACAPSSKRCA